MESSLVAVIDMVVEVTALGEVEEVDMTVVVTDTVTVLGVWNVEMGGPILEKVVQTVIEIVEAAIAMQVVIDMPVPEDLHGMKLASETVQVLMIGPVEALVLMMIVINRTYGGKAMILFSFGPSMSDLFWLAIEIQRICIQEIAGVVTIRVRFERPMLDEVTRK